MVAMEANEIVDVEVKGHVLKRIMPQAGDDHSTGQWEISPKPGVALYYRWPVHNANVRVFSFGVHQLRFSHSQACFVIRSFVLHLLFWLCSL